jgi:AbrB family looped-hinge helix DNA binding protein
VPPPLGGNFRHAQRNHLDVLGKTGKIYEMSTATLSTKGQLVIPHRFRRALQLQPGDKVAIALEGHKLVLQREESSRARLLEKHSRKILVAPPGAPPMNTDTIKAMLADFP